MIVVLPIIKTEALRLETPSIYNKQNLYSQKIKKLHTVYVVSTKHFSV